MTFFRAAALTCAVAAAAIAPARELSLDERFAAQKAIEQVYWSHRNWPKENPGPKPPLSAVLPDDAIRKKVEDALRMSALLDSFWHEPLTGDRLQAEIARMARSTKSPGTLRELFAALHDDPFLIAECLARPALARRRVEMLFGADERIHGAQRAALVAKVRGIDDLQALEHLDGRREEVTFVLDDAAVENRAPNAAGDRSIRLTRDEWSREIRGLAASLGGAWPARSGSSLRATLARDSVERVSGVLDRGDRLTVVAVRSQSDRSVTVVSVSWPKRTYSDWSRVAPGVATTDARAIAPPARGYTLPALGDAACVDDTWAPTAGSEIPDERTGHTAVWTGSEMIVWGGSGEDSYSFNSGVAPQGISFGTGGRFDPATDSWVGSSLSNGSGANTPTPRGGHSAVWTGSEMVVWGGSDGNSDLATGGRYDPSTDTWIASSLTTGSGANVPSARSGHSVVWTGSEMIVWGGHGGGSFLATGGRYDPLADSWAASSLATDAAPNAPTARVGYTAVWTGSEMIVWGGSRYVSNSPVYLSDGARYNPTSDRWVPMTTASNLPVARARHTAVWTGSEMIVWGGDRDGSPLGTGGRYDPVTDSWAASSLANEAAPNTPVAREGHTAVWTGSEMIVWGGSGGGSPLGTGGRYDPVTDSWAASSLANESAPNAPVAGQTAVWTGSEMIVWGGYGVASGGRFDPATDSWVATSLLAGSGANVPNAIQRPSAFWTGAEMIVWASSPDGYALSPSAGGRYDPATDSWAPTDIQSGPLFDRRRFCSVIWTGTEMIVWGGLSWPNSYPLARGAKYSPALDAWVASSLDAGDGANVPHPRFGHTAIWTGTEMIVWGGDGDSVWPSFTGGRYNPATDSWSASILNQGFAPNAPAPRKFHNAVWTGSEMIVWGGNPPLTNGGRYNPSTDSWTPSSLNLGSGPNAPSARIDATAVWTGAEMIVWGGRTPRDLGYSYLADGSRYDPVADRWTPTSTGPNAPSPRALHTAVWTGSEMIVWGGKDANSSALATGGRYSPWLDSWAPSSLGLDTPAPRRSHAAVWTGSADHRMIVWGGLPATHSGALYCAVCRPHPWYRDADGDGRGSASVSVVACDAPRGYVAIGDDCDDTRPSVHAGANEVCNGTDDDCDRTIDEGGASLCDDADVCTNDACNSGTCSHAPCGDEDVCTADGCNTAIGCYEKSINFDTTRFSAHRIDGRDLTVLAKAWNSCPGDAQYKTIANLDNILTKPGSCIDMSDFHLFMNAFGHTCPTGTTP